MIESWESATLGDVLDVLKNGINCKQDKSGRGQKISRIESIANATFDSNRVGYTELSEADKAKYRLQQGDILFSHINSAIHVGKTAIFYVEDEVYHGVNLLLMRPKSYLLSAYLELYLKYIFEQGYWRTTCKQSVNQASVNQQDIKRVPIRFPKDRAEQKRIVTILNKAFAGIAQAVAHAEQNLANARELFESYLNAVFPRKGERWVERRVGDLAERITKGSSPKWQGINYVQEPGVLFITSENVGMNQMDYQKTKFVEEAFNEKDSKSILEKGDVLTNIVGASIGRTAVFDRDDVANINQAVCLIRCEKNKLINKYLAYLLNSPFFRKILHDNEIDNARANLSLGFFRALEIPVPSLEVQKEVVAQIDALSAETQHLESVYQQKLTALAELKQSILQKAFAGELH